MMFGPMVRECWPPFWGLKRCKMSQDGPQKRSKRAKIAITNDFENIDFDVFLTALFKHQASQESPKTATKKHPKTAPDSLREPLKKESSFRLAKKTGPKNASNITRKLPHFGTANGP